MAFFVIPSVDNDANDKDGDGDVASDCEVVVEVDVVVEVVEVDVVVLIAEAPFERIELELSPLFESGTRIYSIRGVAYIIFFTFFFFCFLREYGEIDPFVRGGYIAVDCRDMLHDNSYNNYNNNYGGGTTNSNTNNNGGGGAGGGCGCGCGCGGGGGSGMNSRSTIRKNRT